MTADVLPGDTPAVDTGAPRQTFAKYRRLVPWAVGLSVATLVVLSVYYQTQRGTDVLAELGAIELWVVPAAIGLHLLMQCFWGLRIRLLGGALQAKVPYPRSVALVTSGLFASAVTPGRVGGEPWRIGMLVRNGATGAAASRTILADRAVDMLYFLTLGTIAVLAVPLLFGETGNVRILGTIAILGLGGMIAVVTLILVRPAPIARVLSAAANLPRRLRKRPPVDHAPAIVAFFLDVTGGLRDLVRSRPWTLVAAALLSVALWTCELSILWVVLRGFGFAAPYESVYLAGILVVMIASVPALPGGTGLAEAAALTLLTPLAPGLTPAFLIVWRGLTYYVDLALGGLVAGWLMRPRNARPAPRL